MNGWVFLGGMVLGVVIGFVSAVFMGGEGD